MRREPDPFLEEEKNKPAPAGELADIQPGKRMSTADLKKALEDASVEFHNCNHNIATVQNHLRFMSGRKKTEAENALAEAQKVKVEQTRNMATMILANPELLTGAPDFDPEDFDLYKEYLDYVAGRNQGDKEGASDVGHVFKFREIREKEKAFEGGLRRSIPTVAGLYSPELWMEYLRQVKESAGQDDKAAPAEEHMTPAEWVANDLLKEAGKTAPAKQAYKPFDPTEELERIGVFTEEEKSVLMPAGRVLKKQERMAAFKEQWAEQKLGIAELNAELENMIMTSPTLDVRAIARHIVGHAAELRLSPAQIEYYKEALKNLMKQGKEVSAFFSTFGQEPPESIFKILFGFEPLGRVTVTKGAAYIYFTCSNPADFAAIYKGKKNEQVTPEDVLEMANIGGVAKVTTQIPELNNFVAAGNGEPILTDFIQKHEARHVLHGNIWGMESWGAARPEKDRSKMNMEERFKHTVSMEAEAHLFCAKDEILAYVREMDGPAAIAEKLLKPKEKGGLYDYFAALEKRHESAALAKKDPGAFRRIIDEKKAVHEKMIRENMVVVEKLLTLDYSRERIVGLLETEHPLRWGRVLELLKTTKDYKERKGHAYARWTAEYTTSVERAEKIRMDLKKMREKIAHGETYDDRAERFDRSVRKLDEPLISSGAPIPGPLGRGTLPPPLPSPEKRLELILDSVERYIATLEKKQRMFDVL